MKLVISDDHKGLKAAATRILGATWQRCRVHFARNLLAHAGRQGRRVVSAFVATAFAQEDADSAKVQWRQVADQLRPKVPKLAVLMDEAEHDVLAYMSFPREHRQKLHSTNPIERLHAKAERLLRNLVRRLEHEEPGVSGSILEGLEEILTVIRLGLPHELRRSLACTNIVENALGTVRQVTRNVKRWRHAEMALRWTAAGLLEAQKTFRRLKAYRQLPILRNALQEHLRKAQADSAIETIMKAA